MLIFVDFCWFLLASRQLCGGATGRVSFSTQTFCNSGKSFSSNHRLAASPSYNQTANNTLHKWSHDWCIQQRQVSDSTHDSHQIQSCAESQKNQSSVLKKSIDTFHNSCHSWSQCCNSHQADLSHTSFNHHSPVVSSFSPRCITPFLCRVLFVFISRSSHNVVPFLFLRLSSSFLHV